MIGLIVVGHGEFPKGILTSVKLIAGEQKELIAVNFEAGQGSDVLKSNIEQAIDKLESDKVLILADLAGGSPFNVSAVISEERKDKEIKVISGFNLPMVLETSLLRGDSDLQGLIEISKNSAISGIKEYGVKKVKEVVEDDDGI